MKRPTPIHVQLRAERTRRGLTHDQLATLTGLRRETVCSVENGHGAHLHSVVAMAAALGLELTLLPQRPVVAAPDPVDLVGERYGQRPWTGVA
jgi:transcriptional regulator with XRE-family HTH domain